jgi:hypothetical protein
MILCDLCGEPKNCAQRQIEGKEYDICSECWKSLAGKTEGKGQSKEGAGNCLFASRDKDSRAAGAETWTRRATHDMGLRQFDAMKDDACLFV